MRALLRGGCVCDLAIGAVIVNNMSECWKSGLGLGHKVTLSHTQLTGWGKLTTDSPYRIGLNF